MTLRTLIRNTNMQAYEQVGTLSWCSVDSLEELN